MKVPFRRVRLTRGQCLPFPYGVAWIDYLRDEAICYWVPFNIIARAVREIWFRLSKHQMTHLQMLEKRIFERMEQDYQMKLENQDRVFEEDVQSEVQRRIMEYEDEQNIGG
jgi:hypothetical protein